MKFQIEEIKKVMSYEKIRHQGGARAEPLLSQDAIKEIDYIIQFQSQYEKLSQIENKI